MSNFYFYNYIYLI